MGFGDGDLEVVEAVRHIKSPVTDCHINHEPLAFGPVQKGSFRVLPEAEN